MHRPVLMLVIWQATIGRLPRYPNCCAAAAAHGTAAWDLPRACVEMRARRGHPTVVRHVGTSSSPRYVCTAPTIRWVSSSLSRFIGRRSSFHTPSLDCYEGASLTLGLPGNRHCPYAPATASVDAVYPANRSGASAA